MKIYLVTPKNPASFWTYDEILPALGRRCIFPNLSMPTVTGLTPTQHEIVLCDENVSEIDYWPAICSRVGQRLDSASP